MRAWARGCVVNIDSIQGKCRAKRAHDGVRLINRSQISATMAHRHLVEFGLRAEQISGGDDMATRSSLAYKELDNFEPELEAVEGFQGAMMALLDKHRPSRMPFFRRLAQLPSTIASDPQFLGEIHLIYQAAMHATRAAVYYLPHLDSPALRQRKLRIFNDDDGLPDGDTHHYQLSRAFRNAGAKLLLDDEEFGAPEELCRHLDAETAHFVRLAEKLYSRSLGPWCAVEVMSVDWMRGLADGLSVHFPEIAHEPYFEDCFAQRVEERHADEALEVTQMVIAQRPELLSETLRDAKMMAEALDGVWNNLDRVVQASRRRLRSL